MKNTDYLTSNFQPIKSKNFEIRLKIIDILSKLFFVICLFFILNAANKNSISQFPYGDALFEKNHIRTYWFTPLPWIQFLPDFIYCLAFIEISRFCSFYRNENKNPLKIIDAFNKISIIIMAGTIAKIVLSPTIEDIWIYKKYLAFNLSSQNLALFLISFIMILFSQFVMAQKSELESFI